MWEPILGTVDKNIFKEPSAFEELSKLFWFYVQNIQLIQSQTEWVAPNIKFNL